MSLPLLNKHSFFAMLRICALLVQCVIHCQKVHVTVNKLHFGYFRPHLGAVLFTLELQNEAVQKRNGYSGWNPGVGQDCQFLSPCLGDEQLRNPASLHTCLAAWSICASAKDESEIAQQLLQAHEGLGMCLFVDTLDELKSCLGVDHDGLGRMWRVPPPQSLWRVPRQQAPVRDRWYWKTVVAKNAGVEHRHEH